MIKSIFIVDSKGDVLIEKNYIGHFEKQELEPVLTMIQASIKNQKEVSPIFQSFGSIFLIHKECETYFIGITEGNESILTFAAEYIVNIAKLLTSVIKGGLTTENTKKEYPLIYKVLDQSIDEGYPFLDEPSALIASFSGILDSRISVDRRYPWRGTCEIHGSPEFLINVTEYIDLHVSSTGKEDLNIVRGNINIFCKVPGDPLVSLTTVVPKKLEEVSYHRCVDPNFINSRHIQFIPSDGSFCLMKYVAKPNYTQIPLSLSPKFSWSKVSVSFEISLGIDKTLPQKLNNIVISFDLPKGVVSPSLAAPCGKTSYDESTGTVKWHIDSSNQSLPLILRGSASVENLEKSKSKSIFIRAQFVANGYTASGLKIDNFDIKSNAQSITKAIKYTTKNGVYDFDSLEP